MQRPRLAPTPLSARAKKGTPFTSAVARRTTAALLLCAGLAAAGRPGATAEAAARYTRTLATVEVPDVALVGMDGAPVELRAQLALDGPLLVQFGFTSCATVCPVLSGTISAAQGKLPALRIVSISIDAEADTPERLREQAARFRAGPRWRLLTGEPKAVLAAQRAFDVYRGDKMRHEPVLFLRAAPGTAWVRLEGFPSAADLVAEVQRLSPGGDPEKGRRLYREGVLSSGRPLSGVLQTDVAVTGAQLTCAGCHRRSGFGGVEGTVFVPPVTGPALFGERPLAGPGPFRELFQEELAPTHWSRLRDAPWRPPYTEETLAVALREGRDPAGRTLDPLMPRYELPSSDARHLAAYLRALGSATPPGVEASTLHLATVVAGTVDRAERQAMLDVVSAFVRWRNGGVVSNLRRPAALRYDDTAAGLRRWELHVWELEGDETSWPAQLAERYQEQPVFALLSGLAAGSWKPVETFCERHELPCVFPNTELPGAARGEIYSLYLWPGLGAEAVAVAEALRARRPGSTALRVVQVLRDEERGRVPARALRQALREVPGVRLADRVLARGDELTAAAWERLHASRPDALVLWLGAEDLSHVPAAPGQLRRVYLSAALLGEHLTTLPEPWRDVAYLASPFAPPGNETPHRYRARAWLRSRGVAPRHGRLQLATYFTLSLADHALMHLGRHLSRDAFLEALERETEREPNPGPFPRLSLGPGQRVAAKGCSIFRLADAIPASAPGSPGAAGAHSLSPGPPRDRQP